MIWSDKGFLLSKIFSRKFYYCKFFTQKNMERAPGIIYGATSKKIKNYLQNGNKFIFRISSKNDSSLGYFKIEID